MTWEIQPFQIYMAPWHIPLEPLPHLKFLILMLLEEIRSVATCSSVSTVTRHYKLAVFAFSNTVKVSPVSIGAMASLAQVFGWLVYIPLWILASSNK